MSRGGIAATRRSSDPLASRERLRVVFYDHCAKMSGAEISMLNTLSELNADAVVVLGEDGPLVGALREARHTVEVLPLPSRTRDFSRKRVGVNVGALAQAGDIIRYGRRLAAMIGDIAPDVVVSNSMKGHVLLAAARPFLHVPIVHHVHDRISTDFMSRGGVVVEKGVIGLTGRGVIANSRSTMATVPTGPLHVARAVIGGPVAPPGRLPERRDDEAGSLRFGILGRLSPWKGQDLLLRAFARAFPDDGHTLDIAGAALFGEDEYADRLADLVDELGLTGRVRMLGHVEDVYGLMATWSCVVHASTIPEPFGLVVAQAMVAGVPVVASAEGGPLEMIDAGETGYLFHPRDEAALATVLQQVTADPGSRTAMAQAALVPSQQYTAAAAARRYLAVLGQVVAAGSR